LAKVKKKHRPEFQKKPIARAKHKKKKLMEANPRELRNRGWMVAGFDTSMSSIAGAAIGYDATTKKLRGPEFTIVRWSKEDHYYDRIKAAAKAHEIILDLQHQLRLELNLHEVWIAQEEPWPMGMAVRGGASSFLKQQAEISGAFLGGLMRYGYTQVAQMNSIRWRQVVAQDLGITTHTSKWRDPALADVYNCKPTDTGKFRSKQWALNPGYAFMGAFPNEIPDWPDIIESSTLGKIPRPDTSKAKAVQPDDRYDALAVCWTHYNELLDEGEFDPENSVG
jgi:hypothetical protein